MGNTWQRSSEALMENFNAFMDQFSQIERKKMFGYPCCFKNSYMFTGLHEENWIIRLDIDDRQELINSYETSLFEPMKGKPMREYVVLPKSVLNNKELLLKWMKRSLEFVSSLPPKQKKPRKRKLKISQ